MTEPEAPLGHNPKEAAMLQLFQEKVETKLAQIEKESQTQDSVIKKLQAEIDSLIKLGTTINKELDEVEAQAKPEPPSAKRGGLEMKIDVDDETGNTIKAPQSTREVKTGLIGEKNGAKDPKNRRLSHQAKTDKPSSLTDVEEQKKEPAQKGGKKPAPPTRPVKTENKTEVKAGGEKKGPGAKDKAKDGEEEKKEEEPAEKTPEQVAIDECKNIAKDLNKRYVTEIASFKAAPAPVAKVMEGVLRALGEKTHTWANAQKAVKEADFVKKLGDVKIGAISGDNFKKIRQIVVDEAEAVGGANAGTKLLMNWLQGLVKVRDILKPEEAQEHGDAIAAEKAKKEEEDKKKAEEKSKVEEKKEADKAKKEEEDKKKAEEKKEEEAAEKTPEQIAADECKNLVKDINKKDLTETANLKSPPATIAKVMEAVQRIVGEKTHTWANAQKLLKSTDFIKKLSEVKIGAISGDNFKKIRQLLDDDTVKPEAVKSTSAAASQLAVWLQEIVKVRDILKPEEAQEHAEAIAAEKAKKEEEDKKKEEEAKKKEEEAKRKAEEKAAKTPAPKATKADGVKDDKKTTKKEEKKDEKEDKEDKEKAEKKPAVPKATKTDTTKDDKKTTSKKEEKKDDKEDKEDKEKGEKKPAVPKTPAPKTTKADATKDDKKAATKETVEVKKPDLVNSHPDLKAVLEPLTNDEVTELKGKKIPPPSIQTTIQAVCLLTQGKDHQWAELQKTTFADIASLYKVLDVDVNSFTKKNIEAAEKKLSDKNLEGSVTKAGGAAGILFKWVKAAVGLAKNKEQGAGSTQDVDKAAENKEEQKKEEPKEEIHTEEKHTEEKTAEEKPVEEKPKEIGHKEEPKVEEKPVEEKPKEVEHKEEPKAEVKAHVEEPKKEEPKAEVHAHVEEPKKEEHVEQKNGHAQEEQKEEKPEEKAPEVHEEKINHEVHENNVESKVEEGRNGNGDVAHGKDNTEIVGELNSVLGRDVSGEVHNGDVNEFVKSQVKEADSKLKAVENQIDEFRKDNVSESAEKKPYEIKQSTKEFIQMVQQEWVSELKANDNWDEKIYQILALLFLTQGNQDVPDVKDHAKLRAYAIAKLEKEEADLGGYLMGLEKNLNLDISSKVKIQEFLRDKNPILNPSTFDGVDALCGVISFLMKEACEYLGVIPVELAKKAAAKEKILALSLEKNDYLLEKKGKLVEIANKHGISVDE